jgi:hypothetical protein
MASLPSMYAALCTSDSTCSTTRTTPRHKLVWGISLEAVSAYQPRPLAAWTLHLFNAQRARHHLWPKRPITRHALRSTSWPPPVAKETDYPARLTLNKLATACVQRGRILGTPYAQQAGHHLRPEKDRLLGTPCTAGIEPCTHGCHIG